MSPESSSESPPEAPSRRRPLHAFVLSAGLGERLRPLTDDRPKTMVEIAGHPVLEYHLVLLRELGVREFVINLHHRPEVVSAYFGDGSRWGVRIRYSYEARLLGTAGAMKPVEDLLGRGTFLVVYGDNLFDFDLRPLLAAHAAGDAVATLGVYRGPEPTAGGIVAVDSDGRVRRFLEKPRAEEVFSPLVSAGIYLTEPTVLARIPPGRPSDFGRDVIPSALEGGLRLDAVELHGSLLAIDTPELYRAASATVAAGGLRHPLVLRKESALPA